MNELNKIVGENYRVILSQEDLFDKKETNSIKVMFNKFTEETTAINESSLELPMSTQLLELNENGTLIERFNENNQLFRKILPSIDCSSEETVSLLHNSFKSQDDSLLEKVQNYLNNNENENTLTPPKVENNCIEKRNSSERCNLINKFEKKSMENSKGALEDYLINLKKVERIKTIEIVEYINTLECYDNTGKLIISKNNVVNSDNPQNKQSDKVIFEQKFYVSKDKMDDFMTEQHMFRFNQINEFIGSQANIGKKNFGFEDTQSSFEITIDKISNTHSVLNNSKEDSKEIQNNSFDILSFFERKYKKNNDDVFLTRWKDKYLYPSTVKSTENGDSMILFNDGSTLPLKNEMGIVKFDNLKAGMIIEILQDSDIYETATIISVNTIDDIIHLQVARNCDKVEENVHSFKIRIHYKNIPINTLIFVDFAKIGFKSSLNREKRRSAYFSNLLSPKISNLVRNRKIIDETKKKRESWHNNILFKTQTMNNYHHPNYLPNILSTKNASIFLHLAFIITKAENTNEFFENNSFDKDGIEKIILDGGGTILDILPSLKQLNELHGNNSSLKIILISDRPTKTFKYLWSLAAGIPLISYRWLMDCFDSNNLLSFTTSCDYLLSAGLGQIPDTIIPWSPRTDIFSYVKIFVFEKRNVLRDWYKILEISKAVIINKISQIHVNNDDSELNIMMKLVVSFSDTKIPENILSECDNNGFKQVTSEWIIRCLIYGCIQSIN